MASKWVVISPDSAYAAGCRATCESYYSGIKTNTSHADHIEYTNYQLTATPVSGWTFVGFRVTLQLTTNHGEVIVETPYSYKLTSNPAPEQQVTSDWELPMDYELIGDDGYYYRTIKSEIYKVEAIFEGIPVHNPTHLLVNSATRHAPVSLVYDPATNKLVADY